MGDGDETAVRRPSRSSVAGAMTGPSEDMLQTASPRLSRFQAVVDMSAPRKSWPASS
jgi:hypothetical protein